jgi:hypothetical protein
VRRPTPRATTAAVATVVAVRATGAGPISEARRMRRLASGISLAPVAVVVVREGGEDRLHRDATAGDEVAP